MASESLGAKSALDNHPLATPALINFEIGNGARPFSAGGAARLLSNAYSLVTVMEIGFSEAHETTWRGFAREISDHLVASALAGIADLIALAALMEEEAGK